MSNLGRIIKNSSFEIATYGARSVSLFIVPILLARLSGPELMGQYVTVISLATVFVAVSDFGLPRLLIREIARVRDDKEQVVRLVNASLGLVMIFSFISTALMLAVGAWTGYSTVLIRALLLAGIALAFEITTNVISASFRGSERMEWSWFASFAAEIVLLISLLIVVSLKPRVDWLMAAYLTSRVISLTVGAWLYRPRFGKLWLVLDTKLWRELFKTGFPFALNTAAVLVRERVGVIILAFLSGSVAVALLEVATSLTLRVNVLGRSINDSLYPFLSSQFVRDVRSVPKYTARGIRFLLIPGFLAATLLWVFGEDLVLLLYGKEFAGAVPALRLLALFIPVRMVTHSMSTALTATNRQTKNSMSWTVATIVSVPLNFVLISKYQMMGAAYAILLTEVMLIGQIIWHLRDEVREMITWRPFVGPVLGSLMIVTASFLFDTLNVLLLLILSILLYFLAIMVVDGSSLRTSHLMGAVWRPWK